MKLFNASVIAAVAMSSVLTTPAMARTEHRFLLTRAQRVAARRAARKAARVKARREVRRAARINARRNKNAPDEDIKIIGGHCVADHYCASVRGDPHMFTFDGLKYDCQGHGEFIVAKSMETAFEVQARFQTGDKLNKHGNAVSITKAVVINTGIEGAPILDVVVGEEDDICIAQYYINGEEADFGDDGKGVDGIEAMIDADLVEDGDYVYFLKSGIMFMPIVKKGGFGCVMSFKLCLPPELVQQETIVGLLGTPNGEKADDWMTASGTDLQHGGNTKWETAYDYCTKEWCVHDADNSLFGYADGTSWQDYYGCADSYDPSAEEMVAAPSQECVDCCAPLTGTDNDACLLECMEGDGAEDCQVEIDTEDVLTDIESKCTDTDPKSGPTDPPKPSGSGDPHFKTWTGEKFDYHGECDLVLVDNPSFADGLGLRLHIRTTRVKYFSYIEKAALQIGNDVLEFDNDVEKFLINGVQVPENRKHHKTLLGEFVVRRDPKAISIRLHKEGKAKIDFHTRKNGFPAVIVDPGHTDLFKGSLGLLGEYGTGNKLARDGKTEMNDDDATEFALEWQVRNTEPMLFKDARFPQFPTTCTAPAQQRLGDSHFKAEAEEACAHWKVDMEDCIFDVMATRDVLVANEGHIIHVE